MSSGALPGSLASSATTERKYSKGSIRNEYLAAGLPIASGAVEGACKNLVKDRMERSGMRWKEDSAEAMLRLRATYLSGDFVARFKGSREELPGYIAIPEVAVRSSVAGEFKRARLLLRGGGSGFLGQRFDPLVIDGEPGAPEAIPALGLPDGVSPGRFEARTAMLSLIERGEAPADSSHDFRALRRRAILLTGTANGGGSRLFSLDSEPARVRDRYGRHRFGQTMLLARRLTEAGVPFVAVHFNEMTRCDGWDTHQKDFEALEGELLPLLDQSLSALIEDLDQRGRLEETMIVCLGEFGRTPKINQNAGRDHWGTAPRRCLPGAAFAAVSSLASRTAREPSRASTLSTPWTSRRPSIIAWASTPASRCATTSIGSSPSARGGCWGRFFEARGIAASGLGERGSHFIGRQVGNPWSRGALLPARARPRPGPSSS